ncbi:uncharacterized protein BJX67DRAFT_344143 [Aspergillus lucknowensis]|uniref:Uncharacterized protein n=1 Tax=Aspergillus lucknowensis TaxID=176173 RepID=A0ABR4M1T8_9EURO
MERLLLTEPLIGQSHGDANRKRPCLVDFPTPSQRFSYSKYCVSDDDEWVCGFQFFQILRNATRRSNFLSRGSESGRNPHESNSAAPPRSAFCLLIMIQSKFLPWDRPPAPSLMLSSQRSCRRDVTTTTQLRVVVNQMQKTKERDRVRTKPMNGVMTQSSVSVLAQSIPMLAVSSCGRSQHLPNWGKASNGMDAG